MFKINIKDTTVSSVSVVNFEHLIAGRIAETQLGPCQSSMMELVEKTSMMVLFEKTSMMKLIEKTINR